MKRLRKKFPDKKIKYFHCGEYGEQTLRPHYHACIFGLDFEDKKEHSMKNDIVTYVSETLEKIWGMGFCTTGELTYESAAYTARYVLKKVTGNRAEEHYQRVDGYTGEIYQVQPEYITMSLGRRRGEGIGGSFYAKYKNDFFPSDECPVPGKGVYHRVPAYYETLYKEEDPDSYRAIKKRRRKWRDEHALDLTGRRLDARYIVTKAKLKQLKRNL